MFFFNRHISFQKMPKSYCPTGTRKERRNLAVYLSATHLCHLEMHKSILQLWRPIVWLLMELDTPLWAFFVDPLKGGFPIFCLLPCLYLYPAALLLYLQSRLIRVNPLRGEGQSYHKQISTSCFRSIQLNHHLFPLEPITYLNNSNVTKAHVSPLL